MNVIESKDGTEKHGQTLSRWAPGSLAHMGYSMATLHRMLNLSGLLSDVTLGGTLSISAIKTHMMGLDLAPWLRTLATLAEDQSSVPSTHVSVHSLLSSRSRGSDARF